MKTPIICIPPEPCLRRTKVKKFLRWLSEETRGFWEPRCPGCGSKRDRRDGVEPRKTAPPAQRYECPQGKKFCDKTGPEPLREARPLRQDLLGLHPRVPRDGGWDGARGWNSGGSPWTQEVGRRRDLRQGRGENNVPGVRGGGLGGQDPLEGSLPQKEGGRGPGMVLSQGRPGGCGKP